MPGRGVRRRGRARGDGLPVAARSAGAARRRRHGLAERRRAAATADAEVLGGELILPVLTGESPYPPTEFAPGGDAPRVRRDGVTWAIEHDVLARTHQRRDRPWRRVPHAVRRVPGALLGPGRGRPAHLRATRHGPGDLRARPVRRHVCRRLRSRGARRRATASRCGSTSTATEDGEPVMHRTWSRVYPARPGLTPRVWSRREQAQGRGPPRRDPARHGPRARAARLRPHPGRRHRRRARRQHGAGLLPLRHQGGAVRRGVRRRRRAGRPAARRGGRVQRSGRPTGCARSCGCTAPVGSASGWPLWIDAWAAALREPALRRVSRRLDVHWKNAVAAVIEEGVAEGELTCPDPHAAAWRITAMLDGLAVQVTVHKGVVSRRELNAVGGRADRARAGSAGRGSQSGLRAKSGWTARGSRPAHLPFAALGLVATRPRSCTGSPKLLRCNGSGR